MILSLLRPALDQALRAPLRQWPLLLVLVLLSKSAGQLGATDITVKNGSQYQGRVGKRASLAESPLKANTVAGEVNVKQIVYIDDELRRTYVSSMNVTAVGENPPVVQERIKLDQPVAEGGRRVGSVGAILAATPFDKWGRRTVTMNTSQGRLDVVQGITELTPEYARVEGLMVKNPIVWEMRMATSALPRETLSAILLNRLDSRNPEDRLRIVRFYTQAERYQEARAELEAILQEFPELADLERHVKTLRQLGANLLIREIELRRQAGQHRLSRSMLQSFPAEGVAGETLLKVRDMLAEYERIDQQGQRALTLLDQSFGQVADEGLRQRLEPIVAEIRAELGYNTLDRMADFLRLADDPQLNADSKLALAVSGWLMGSGSVAENLAVAASLAEARDAIGEYLRAGRKADRDAVLAKLQSLEGATAENITKILARVKAPRETTAEPVAGVPGFFELSVPGTDEQAEFWYSVQLPPEYDPHRKYPCIVSLHGEGMSDQQMLEWWAGPYDEKTQLRLGQAARHGYIVLAPRWTKPYQLQYEYSLREHAAVLFPLRDALQRFSIDTDRVFLTGHSLGGDAAWDIGLAHPDLWCGVIPIVATSAKYVTRYAENARLLPLYFVLGELDGNELQENGTEFDRYLTRAGYDCTVVEYLGRGHEHFFEEIQRLFSWMNGLPKRNFFPQDFTCYTMRRWDNFFWWLELSELPPNTIAMPLTWTRSSDARPLKTTARIYPEANRVSVSSGAGKVTVWLSPEMVSFDRRITVAFDGRNYNPDLTPSTEVILEDARTRGDRLHPFWVKVDSQSVRRR